MVSHPLLYLATSDARSDGLLVGDAQAAPAHSDADRTHGHVHFDVAEKEADEAAEEALDDNQELEHPRIVYWGGCDEKSLLWIANTPRDKCYVPGHDDGF